MNIIKNLRIVNEEVGQPKISNVLGPLGYCNIIELEPPLMFLSTYLCDINIHRCRMVHREKERLKNMEIALMDSICFFSSSPP